MNALESANSFIATVHHLQAEKPDYENDYNHYYESAYYIFAFLEGVVFSHSLYTNGFAT